MPRPIRILSISHSYVVGLNRRLPSELARVGGADWQVTAAGPAQFHGDLRDERLERRADEACDVRGLPGYLSRRIHFFHYGRGLRTLLREGWDLVHMWEEPYVVAGAQLAALLPTNVPLVFSTFQNIRKQYPLPFRRMERYVLERSAGWISYGETVTSTLRDRPGYVSLPTVTIPPGVDTELFRPDETARAATLRHLGWSSDGAPDRRLLGRFVPEKGLEFLLRVLESQTQPWRAMFVGTGPLEGMLRRWGRDSARASRSSPTHDTTTSPEC